MFQQKVPFQWQVFISVSLKSKVITGLVTWCVMAMQFLSFKKEKVTCAAPVSLCYVKAMTSYLMSCCATSLK